MFKQDLSAEKKKNILLKKLHESIIVAFSINKSKFIKRSLEPLKKRLHNIRKIVDKLRSINYYLETIFLEELKIAGIRAPAMSPKLERKPLARDELDALEYAAYQLIGKVVVLDKKLLSGYSKKEKIVAEKEKGELDIVRYILAKESELLHHLEAKIPPENSVSKRTLTEPFFSHWASRIVALLGYLEHVYKKEKRVFSHLKKNKLIRSRIRKKISHLIKERTNLIIIMEKKALAMEKFAIDNRFKKELHNLTTVMRV